MQFISCHLNHFQEMNVYTPYIFELEVTQRAELKRMKGFAPKFFNVYQTYKGFNDAGPHWNLALQFTESKFEIPLDLLISDHKSEEAQSTQGWKSKNPCFPKIISK